MPDFSLLSVSPTLRDKIITKFEIKSYFRLQQTCHSIYDFIRKSKNITVHLNGFPRKRDHFLQYAEPSCKIGPFSNLDIEIFYGVRLDVINTAIEEGNILPDCDCFKKYRITCDMLGIDEGIWTTERCATIIALLKPVQVVMISDNSNQYDALLNSRIPRSVDVCLNEDNYAVAAEKLLPIFPEIEICLPSQQIDEYHFFKTILLILSANFFPNLKTFKCSISWAKLFSSKDELVEQLRDFNITVETSSRQELAAVVEMPHHFPPETTCKLFINWGVVCWTGIEFKTGDVSS